MGLKVLLYQTTDMLFLSDYVALELDLSAQSSLAASFATAMGTSVLQLFGEAVAPLVRLKVASYSKRTAGPMRSAQAAMLHLSNHVFNGPPAGCFAMLAMPEQPTNHFIGFVSFVSSNGDAYVLETTPTGDTTVALQASAKAYVVPARVVRVGMLDGPHSMVWDATIASWRVPPNGLDQVKKLATHAMRNHVSGMASAVIHCMALPSIPPIEGMLAIHECTVVEIRLVLGDGIAVVPLRRHPCSMLGKTQWQMHFNTPCQLVVEDELQMVMHWELDEHGVGVRICN